MSSYCTYADIVAFSDTALPQATVEVLIVDADRELNAMLKARGLAADYADDDLHSAGIQLTLARLITRRRLDGTFVSSQSSGGVSQSDSLDKMIDAHNAKAAELVAQYAASSQAAPTDGAVRCDLDMSDFRPGRMALPRYGEE